VKGCTLSKMEDGRWKMVAVGVCRRTRVDPRVCEGVYCVYFKLLHPGTQWSHFRVQPQPYARDRRKNSRACGRKIIIMVVPTRNYLFICRDLNRVDQGGSPESHAYAHACRGVLNLWKIMTMMAGKNR
jgi:hypothetical protein